MDKVKKKSVTINSIFYLIYNVFNVIFPFLTGIYVTHILLPETIGQVEIARNFAQYFVILSFLGIPTYGMKEVSKYRKEKEKLDKIYSELMLINFISTLFFSVVYVCLIYIIPDYREYANLFLITGISIIINIFNNEWLFEGLEEFGYISVRNIVFKILSFLLLILFVKKSDDYIRYAMITVVGTVGNHILNFINSNKYVKMSFKNLNLKKHMKSILYLTTVCIAIEIYSIVDITMLGHMSLKENVAFYSYGMKIHRIILHTINTFTIVLVPNIALFYKEGRIKEYNELLSKAFKVILLISIPLIIGIQFTANYLITKIYGLEFIRSAYVLRILSIILLIAPIGYLLGSRVCLVTDNENKMAIPVILGAITNVICNYFLIPMYHETGAAIASVIGELIVMILYLIIGKNYYQLFNIKRSLIKEIIAVLIMTLYLYLISALKISLLFITILQIIGAIVIYFSALLFLREEFVCGYTKRILTRLRKCKERLR